MDPIQPQTPEIPREFYCPIYKEVMVRPVVSRDGFSYEERAWQNLERSAIWPLRSPMTGLRIARGYTPNHTLRALIGDCVAAQPILQELQREQETLHPLARDLHAPVVAALDKAKAAAYSVAGAFPGGTAGMLIGWLLGEWLIPGLNPNTWYAGPLRLNNDLSREMARAGARLGAGYGAINGLRVGLKYDTLEAAVHRSCAQVSGVLLGVFLGGMCGAVLGASTPPLICFTLNTCHNDGLDAADMASRAYAMGCVGAALGLFWGLHLAKELNAPPPRRRRA